LIPTQAAKADSIEYLQELSIGTDISLEANPVDFQQVFNQECLELFGTNSTSGALAEYEVSFLDDGLATLVIIPYGSVPLTPQSVPDPASVSLLLAGLGFIALRRKRLI
jgi:hypothetical protein